MKLKKRKVISPKKGSTLVTRGKRSKGIVDAGTVYGAILLSVLVGGGLLMLGNIGPKLQSPDEQQPAIIQNSNDGTRQDNLQMKTFDAITHTPTPTPSPTPTPLPTIPPAASGGGGCFPEGTKVLMADGTRKNIEEVKAGEKVVGYDGKKQATVTVLEVETRMSNNLYSLSFSDGAKLDLTSNHAVYTKDGWKSLSPKDTMKETPGLTVSTLKAGDEVLGSNGKYSKVSKVTALPGTVQTYNLKSVSDYNNFYAGEKLVHNKGGGGGGGGGSK